MVADMLSNKKLNPILMNFCIRGRKLHNSPVLTAQSNFSMSKYIRLNSTHYFIMKIPNKLEL